MMATYYLRIYDESWFILRRCKQTIATCMKCPELQNLKLLNTLWIGNFKRSRISDLMDKKECLITSEFVKSRTKLEIANHFRNFKTCLTFYKPWSKVVRWRCFTLICDSCQVWSYKNVRLCQLMNFGASVRKYRKVQNIKSLNQVGK